MQHLQTDMSDLVSLNIEARRSKAIPEPSAPSMPDGTATLYYLVHALTATNVLSLSS